MAQPPVKAGTCGKNVAPPGVPKDWKRRHIVLEGNGAFRIHDAADKPPLLILPVKDCSQRVQLGDEFHLQYPGKLHEFKVGNPEEAQSWIAAFNSVFARVTGAPGPGQRGGHPPGLATNRGSQPPQGVRPGAPPPGALAQPRGGPPPSRPGQAPQGAQGPNRPQQAPAQPPPLAHTTVMEEAHAPAHPTPQDDMLSDLDSMLAEQTALDLPAYDDWPSLDPIAPLHTEMDTMDLPPAPPVSSHTVTEHSPRAPEYSPRAPSHSPPMSLPSQPPAPADPITPRALTPPTQHTTPPPTVDHGPELARLQQQLNDLNAALQDKEHAHLEAQKARETMQHKLIANESIIDQLKTQLEDSKAIAELAQLEMEELKEKTQQQMATTNTGTEHLINDLKTQLMQARQEMQEVKAAHEGTRRQLAARGEELALVLQQSNDKTHTIQDREAAIETMRNDMAAKEARIATLTQQTQAMGQSAGAFTEQLQRQVSDLQSKLAQSKVALQSALKRGEDQAATIAQFEQDLIEMDNNLQEHTTLTQAREKRINEMTQAMDKMTLELDHRNEDLRESHAKMMDMQTALAKAEQQAADRPKEMALSTSGDWGGSNTLGYIDKIKEKDTMLAQLTAKLKAREVELHALKSDAALAASHHATLEANLEQLSTKLEETTRAAVEAEEQITQLEGHLASLNRLKAVVTEKEQQIAALQEARDTTADEATRNTRIGKKNQIIEQLNATINDKERLIVEMEGTMKAIKAQGWEGKLKLLETKLNVLQAKYDAKKKMCQQTQNTLDLLKQQFSSAYEDGRIVTNITDIDLRFKVEEADHSKRIAEANLAKQEAHNKELRERCDKLERALVTAKKVDFIENKFTEYLRLIEGQKKHNRGAYKQMCERVTKETEEKKVLQAKLLLLKSEYKKLTSPGEGPTQDELKDQLTQLKSEVDVKTAKLNQITTEYKALAQKFALLEAEFEK